MKKTLRVVIQADGHEMLLQVHFKIVDKLPQTRCNNIYACYITTNTLNIAASVA